MSLEERRRAYWRRKSITPRAEQSSPAEVETPPRNNPWRPKRPLAFERRLRAAKLKAIVFQGGRIARHD